MMLADIPSVSPCEEGRITREGKRQGQERADGLRVDYGQDCAQVKSAKCRRTLQTPEVGWKGQM